MFSLSPFLSTGQPHVDNPNETVSTITVLFLLDCQLIIVYLFFDVCQFVSSFA